MKLHFYCVTTKVNYSTLLIALPRLIKIYGEIDYTLICPKKDLQVFKVLSRKYPFLKLLCEEEIISIDEFNSLADDYAANKSSYVDKGRINWYYQQAIKIAFAIRSKNKKEILIMWDADSIPIEKIQFFDEFGYKIYGSLIERHEPYFITIKKIFDFRFPEYGYTIQFMVMKYRELSALEDIFKTYIGEKGFNYSIGQLASRVIIKSVLEAHGKISECLFSEQELIGALISKNNNSVQKPIMHFRPGVNWEVGDVSESILKLLGYKYLSIENHHFISNKIMRVIYINCFLLYDYARQIYKLSIIKYSCSLRWNVKK